MKNKIFIIEIDPKEDLDSFWVELENWKHLDLKPNEEKVVQAICILMKEADYIEIFNKK